jgi:hypothetical protein
MRRIDSEPDFFGEKRVVNFLIKHGRQRRDLGDFPMAYRPFVSSLSVLTAYIAFALVGAIVLGMF